MVVGHSMFSTLHQNTLSCVGSQQLRNSSAHPKDIEAVVHILRVCAVSLHRLRHMICTLRDRGSASETITPDSLQFLCMPLTIPKKEQHLEHVIFLLLYEVLILYLLSIYWAPSTTFESLKLVATFNGSFHQQCKPLHHKHLHCLWLVNHMKLPTHSSSVPGSSQTDRTSIPESRPSEDHDQLRLSCFQIGYSLICASRRSRIIIESLKSLLWFHDYDNVGPDGQWHYWLYKNNVFRPRKFE